MKRNFQTAFLMLLMMTLLTGIIYPLAATGLAQLFFREKANGSIAYINKQPVGSYLIGQQYSDPKYFQGRPSSAGTGYDAAASSGSNLGSTNQKLISDITNRVSEIRSKNRIFDNALIPADLVTSSASGLDPHISPAGATLQIERVARERGVSVEVVSRVVLECTEEPQWGFMGQARVNVLKANMLLDQLH
ncbi:MAG TPA: potassium-transporting ATPase subunit KdpC [Syntrophomonadaceae bacterium]|nr:potassium-transporting ATPase subunit KdpC [Syntrophomonadaceae bacterium]